MCGELPFFPPPQHVGIVVRSLVVMTGCCCPVSRSVVSDSLQPHGAHPAPLSMAFSRQEYWSGLPFPAPGDLPDPGIEPRSPVLQADSLPSELPGKPNDRLGQAQLTSNPIVNNRVYILLKIHRFSILLLFEPPG